MGDSSPSPMRNHQRICKKKKKERNIWIILDRWSLLEVSQCFPSGFSNGFPDGFSASMGAFNTMESFPLGALFSTTSMAPRCQRPWTMPAGDLQNLHTIYICMYNIRMCIYIYVSFIYIYIHMNDILINTCIYTYIYIYSRSFIHIYIYISYYIIL